MADTLQERAVLTREERDACYQEWNEDTNDALFEIMCKHQIVKVLADPEIAEALDLLEKKRQGRLHSTPETLHEMLSIDLSKELFPYEFEG